MFSLLIHGQFLGFWCLIFLGRLAMASGWIDLIRGPFRSHEHFVSVDARRLSVSDPRNYEMLTSPQYTFGTGEKRPVDTPRFTFSKEVQSPGLAMSPQSDSDYFTPRETEFKERTYSFSQPRPPSRAASKSSHRVTFSREGPASPPLSSAAAKDWPTFPEEIEPVHATTVVTTAVPQQQVHQLQYQQPQQQQIRTGSALSSNGSAWERSPSAQSNGTRSGSALGREHAGAALGREWQAPATQRNPTPQGPTLPRSNSALGRDRGWDPRSTYAQGTGRGAGAWNGRNL